jgi:hypothetical protein
VPVWLVADSPWYRVDIPDNGNLSLKSSVKLPVCRRRDSHFDTFHEFSLLYYNSSSDCDVSFDDQTKMAPIFLAISNNI